MLGRKKIPSPGRQRPPVTSDRRSSSVFSYHASRAARPVGADAVRNSGDAQQSGLTGAAAARRTNSHHRLKRAVVTCGMIMIGLLLISSLYLSTQPTVVRASSANGQIFLRSEDVYRQAAANILAGSMLNRTKLTINGRSIAQKLAAQFPELGGVTVTLPIVGHQPVVHVEPASPALIVSTTGGQSYILDTSGRALLTPSQVPGLRTLGSLPVVSDQSGLPVTLGHVALPGSSTRFITEVAAQLQAAHITVVSLTLPKGTSELDARVSGAPYAIKFNLQGDARVEAGTYLAVKQRLDQQHKTPSSYIDVRVDGRAYYK